MSLVIYNTLTRKKEKFEPLTPGKVKMYVCGPTVYNFLHVGNFRGPVFFNLVRNWLEEQGYQVTFALNFTDVDDRIIERAQKEGKDSREISELYIHEYKKDYQILKLRPHEVNPKVTEHMEPIRQMVQDLIAKGRAYVAADGEVLYSIKAFQGYGKLSNRNPDELVAGARVEVDEKKQNPLDFALWKPSKAGEPSWPSPWCDGRPGWHIECSAMIKKIFGDQIDIHGGGSDLIFPHHENEIAQSEGASEKPFVKYWMHNNMLNFSGVKMSKSLGNIVRLRDFVQDYHPEIYKYMILSAHYRSVSDFGDQAIEKAVRELARMYSALSLAEDYIPSETDAGEAQADEKLIAGVWEKIESSLNDDFATPEVMATLFDLVRSFNSQVKKGMKATPQLQGKAIALKLIFNRLSRMMSLFGEPAKQFLNFLDEMLLKKMNLSKPEVDTLVQKRWQAKQAKDFKTADELRDQLLKMGISVMDTPSGPEWEVTK
jgi:cysteinyl-tRNA synthetase